MMHNRSGLTRIVTRMDAEFIKKRTAGSSEEDAAVLWFSTLA